MIGIIGAMKEEITELYNNMKNIDEVKIAGLVFFKGELCGKDIVLVESGIGKVNAAMCTTILIERFNIKKLLFTGVAGAVNHSLNVGDVVISTDLIQHDVDVTAFGSKPGEIPRMKNYIFEADKELVKIALDSALTIFGEKNVVSGRIISGDQFINSMEKLEHLRKIFKADCVEMEGAAVAHVCTLYNLPFVILRAISDKADHSANIDFHKFVETAAKNSKIIIMKILTKMV